MNEDTLYYGKVIAAFCIVAFLIVALVYPVNGEYQAATTIIKVEGTTGATIANTCYNVETSGGSLGFITGGENYNTQSAGSHIVTLGDSSYTDTTVANNRVKNTYTRQNNLTFEDGAVASNTYSMTDNKVNIPDEECDGAGNATGAALAANGIS